MNLTSSILIAAATMNAVILTGPAEMPRGVDLSRAGAGGAS